MARWDGHVKLPGTASQRYVQRYPQRRHSTNQRYKLAALGAYSNGRLACASCGYDNVDALALDHVNDDGAAWRKQHGVTGGANTYHKLYQLGYPEGFQVLCANCNTLKEVARRKK